MNSFLIICLAACLAALASAQCGCNPKLYYPPEKDENGLYEGDILLTEEQEEMLTSGFRNQISTGKRWPNGIIPYRISDSKLNSYNIPKALADFQSKLGNCIKFKPYKSGDKDYVNVIYGSGCFSMIGRTGGVQKLSLGSGCGSTKTIHHEFMHAIGFHHEQVRPDREKHVTIHWNNIKSNMCGNFQTYGKLPPFAYDYKSVMHYSSGSFSCNGKKTMTKKDGSSISSSPVSSLDIAKIKNLYGCK